jgi:hypothetical protein
VAGAWAVAGPVVVVGPLTARRPGFGVVEGGGVVVGSRGAVVVVLDTDVGAGCVGDVGSATPGTRCGGSGWGGRVAEATRAARTAVVSPKTNSSNLQGGRGLARCRGGGVGMVHHPGSAGSSGSLGVPGSRPLTGCIGRSYAQRIERYVPASLTDVSPRRRPADLLLGVEDRVLGMLGDPHRPTSSRRLRRPRRALVSPAVANGPVGDAA